MLYGQDDERALRDSEASNANWWRAAQLLDATVKRLEIPYQGTAADGSPLAVQLPAYLFIPHPSKRVPERQRKRGGGKGLPLLVNMVGADATQEEIFFVLPQAALELGYAVLTFEGPGQGIVLRRHNMPFRPDWEEVLSPVLDFVLDTYLPARTGELPQIDRDQVAVAGSSMGGYLALRGARDPRVKACIAVDPFYRMWDLLKGRVPDSIAESPAVPDWVWDNMSALLGWWNVQTRWELKLTGWMLGARPGSAADNFRQMRRYTLEDGQLELVRCPVFVTGARHSLYSSPEVSTERVYRELVNVSDDDKAMWIGEDEGEGGLAAKAGAFGVLNQKAFAWLDGVFGIERRISSTFKQG